VRGGKDGEADHLALVLRNQYKFSWTAKTLHGCRLVGRVAKLGEQLGDVSGIALARLADLHGAGTQGREPQ
jgi:hypothetical protein